MTTESTAALGAPPDHTFLPRGRMVGFGNGFTWISDAFGLFMAAPLAWLAFTVVFIIAALAFAMVPLIGQFLFNLVSPIILAGVMVSAQSLARGEAVKPEDFMAGFTGKPMPLLVVGALYMAGSLIITAAFVGVVIAMLGTAFFAALLDPARLTELYSVRIVLGLLIAALVALALYLPLLMAYWFAVPLVQFHDVPPVEAMKASFIGCVKNMLPFLLYGVVSLVLLLLAIIPLGLGLLVMAPVLMLTMYTGYKDAFFAR
ncbi:MAG: hypothetical protein JNM76_05695 [Betaproteobacteria bacterium]|nr:hypothetical protein [Betaproteobacteria bacterium]